MEAQEGISELKIDDICDFLKVQFTKFDAFYTIQEYILFLLRNLFNYPVNFEVDYSKAMNLLVGLPVYNLNPKLRQDLVEWCEGRNFPEELYANSQDSIRRTGYTLSIWCQKMLDIFKSLENNYFETKETREKTQFHAGVEDITLDEGRIQSVYAPVLGDDVDFALINLGQDIYLSKLDFSATIVEGNVISKFAQISLSSTDESFLNRTNFLGLFKKILSVKETFESAALGKTVEENSDASESKYIVVAQRNNFLASFDFPDDCLNPEFYGEMLFFQKVNNLHKFTSNPSEYKLLLFQLCKDYFVPVVAKKSETLKSLVVEVTKLVNDHGFELKEEQIMQSTEFNGE